MCAHDPLEWENYTLSTGRACSKGLRTFKKKINLRNETYLKKGIKHKTFREEYQDQEKLGKNKAKVVH